MSRPVITLTTDFGLADGYVGTMKGAMLGICPQATLVDISHGIRPQAVRQAAYILAKTTPYFPPNAVHLVVVDPGVGSARRPIAVQTARAVYVAPDNGVLGWVLAQDPARMAVHITEPRYHLPHVSTTFHGRDLFAPVAAHLACGTDLRELGEVIPVPSLVAQPALRPELQADGSWQGEILHVDHFGNLVTSFQVPAADAQTSGSQFCAIVGQERLETLSRTFADVEPGELVVYVGSDGYLEVAVRNGNAAARLKVDVADPVWVKGIFGDESLDPNRHAQEASQPGQVG